LEGVTAKLRAPVMLLMWGGLYWMWSSDLLVTQLAIGLGLCHLICLMIFYHFVYVFNYGYAMTMIVLPAWYGLSYDLTSPARVVLALAVLYGLRLMSFTWLRYRSDSYAERAQRATKASQAIPLPGKLVIWLFASMIMFFLSFNTWVVASSNVIHAAAWPAIMLMAAGLALEAIADDQKQRAKKANKNALCSTGLYMRIRHPNFLGEMIFHIGLYAAMAAMTDVVYTLILGSLGTGWVLILMTDRALVYDRTQQETYGATEEFAEYRRNTGLLWPKMGSDSG
jgi:steroid 5-alpha reductase family enzyme